MEKESRMKSVYIETTSKQAQINEPRRLLSMGHPVKKKAFIYVERERFGEEHWDFHFGRCIKWRSWITSHRNCFIIIVCLSLSAFVPISIVSD